MDTRNLKDELQNHMIALGTCETSAAGAVHFKAKTKKVIPGLLFAAWDSWHTSWAFRDRSD